MYSVVPPSGENLETSLDFAYTLIDQRKKTLSDLHSDSASVLHTRTTSNPELRMNSNNIFRSTLGFCFFLCKKTTDRLIVQMAHVMGMPMYVHAVPAALHVT
uniref:Uncharacterized protein n=1 Tax=Pristionchus pacificus TaxID=54126 RepID=A0A2A6C6W7_PRIPA